MICQFRRKRKKKVISFKQNLPEKNILKVAIIKKKKKNDLVKKLFPFYKKLRVGSSVLGLSDIFLQTIKKQTNN